MSSDSLHEIQKAFAAHIRNPEGVPEPSDVSSDRMKVYRELFFNNVESFMRTGFPVLHAILEGPRWSALVRDFYREHVATTPLFVEIAGEFVTYLVSERGTRPGDLPFLKALAHYEWVELALSVRESDPPVLNLDFMENPLGFRPRVSEVAWLLSYPYPVQTIGPDHQPQVPDENPVQLLVYRGRDELVHFLELNPVTHRLLQSLESAGEDELSEILGQLAREIGHPDASKVLGFGADLMRDLHQKGAVAPEPPLIPI